MKRIYHSYEKWEDWKKGLYKLDMYYSEIELEELTNKCKKLLSNQKEFYLIAYKVITKWKYASEQNLSNKARNRQAWIGQASCCYKCGVPESITKLAWRMLTPEQQLDANITADEIINIWDKRYSNAKKI